MIRLINLLPENIVIPVKIGDTILTGRFKNKKTVVKTISNDEHGMPTINGRKVVTFRMAKDEKDENITEVVLGEFSPFRLKKGFKFVANNTFGKIKKGYKYIVDDIKGTIGNLEIMVKKVGDSTTIPINVHSTEEFYSNVMLKEGADIDGLSGGNNSARWTVPGKQRELNIPSLSGYQQTDFPKADSLDISKEKYHWMGRNGNKYHNKVRAIRQEDGTLKFE